MDNQSISITTSTGRLSIMSPKAATPAGAGSRDKDSRQLPCLADQPEVVSQAFGPAAPSEPSTAISSTGPSSITRPGHSDQRPDHGWIDDIPDPLEADLPSIGYKQIITALEGPEKVAGWVALALVMRGRPDWKFTLCETTPTWIWDQHPDFSASFSQWKGQPPTFELFRQRPDDEVEAWEFSNPEDVLTLADDILRGLPAPSPLLLGPWIEEPYLAWFAGIGPCPFERSDEAEIG